MIDLTKLSDADIDELIRDIRSLQSKRREAEVENQLLELKKYIGRYFCNKNRSQYYRPIDITTDETCLRGNVIHVPLGDLINWASGELWRDIYQARTWTEITKQEWEDAKEQLIENATKDWRENL